MPENKDIINNKGLFIRCSGLLDDDGNPLPLNSALKDLSDADIAVLNGLSATAATAAEIDQQCDVSAYQETITAAGAISISKKVTKLAVASGGAVTLAAPNAAQLGMVKLIEMSVDGGDVTLALTNVDGQSSGTTATFDSVGDALTLIAGVSKWHVLGEASLTLS